MDFVKRMEYLRRLLERVEKEIENSGTDYDYLQIMFEAKSNLVGKITKYEELIKPMV